MNKLVAGLAVAAALMNSIAMAEAPKPTIVLVHGAFADTSSWNAVIRILDEDGYPVVAAANPMRSVHGMRSTLMRFCPASNPQSSWSVIPMAASLSAKRPMTR
jgi:pimeloyl-ACP methyl ester carboxylesterase